jgi:hypothetical protein
MSRRLPRELLIAHLTVHGWVPVAATREALQRGAERVNIVERPRGLSVQLLPALRMPLPRTELPWGHDP